MPSPVSVISNPHGTAVLVKSFTVTRSMTAGTDKAFALGRGCRILGFVLQGKASDAASTATLSIGTTSGTPTEFVNGVSVLAAGVGDGNQYLKGVSDSTTAKLTVDTMIFVKYAETGTASTTGGWTLSVIYSTPGTSKAGTE